LDEELSSPRRVHLWQRAMPSRLAVLLLASVASSVAFALPQSQWRALMRHHLSRHSPRPAAQLDHLGAVDFEDAETHDQTDDMLDEIESELAQHDVSMHGSVDLQPWHHSRHSDAACYVLHGEHDTDPTWLLCSEPPETRDGELECEEDWLGLGRPGEFLCRIKYDI